jgi:hypothetical protein
MCFVVLVGLTWSQLVVMTWKRPLRKMIDTGG